MWEWLDNWLHGATLRVRRRKALARFSRIEATLFRTMSEVNALGRLHDHDKEHTFIRQDIRALLRQLQNYRVTWGLLEPDKVKEEVKRCLREAV